MPWPTLPAPAGSILLRWRLLEVLVEELLVHLLRLVVGEGRPTVAGVLLRHHRHLHLGLLQRLREPLALGNRHRFVGIAVDDEEGWVVLADVREDVAAGAILGWDAGWA